MSEPFQPRSWRNRGRMPEPHRVRLALRSAELAFPDAAAAATWAPQILDIGFGYGESLLALGRAYPGARVLGVDPHSPGQLRAMDALTAAGLDDDVRVLPGDVVELLPLLAPGSLQLVQALHPDPWPKRRHADRRLLSAAVLARIADLLAPGGAVHMVIDDDVYADSVRAAADAIDGLIPWSQCPAVPETKYGRRARAAGRTAHDLAWKRV